MMRRAYGKWMAMVTLAALVAAPVGGWGATFDLANSQGEFGLRLAYGSAISKASVNLYTLLPRWGIFLVRPGKTSTFGVSFVLEGIFSVAEAENTGTEIGITPMVKVSARLFPGVIAFIEGGAGVISESFNSPAVPNVFNFTPQIGAGFDIALTPRLALTAAYRFRHSSNAGIYQENHAFNVNFVQAGLTYFY
jgi:opacity protein-like surface antigen